MPKRDQAPEIVRFGDVAPKRSKLNADPLTPNTELVIRSVEWVNIGRFEGAVINTADGKRYYTFSKVIMDQLRSIEETLRNGKLVSATVRKRRNYYVLE